MPNPLSRSLLLPSAVTAYLLGAGWVMGGPARATIQPLGTDNPFAVDDIPGLIPSTTGGSTESSGIDVGEGGSRFPNFPGLPEGSLPDSPGGDILGTVNDVLKNPTEGVIDILGRTMPGGLPAGVPDIFRDILSGDIGGILGGIFDIFTTESDLFADISKIVLGDGWGGAGSDGKAETPPDPYKVRLPTAGEIATSRDTPDEQEKPIGLLTRNPIVYRRDQANQYDQELARAMAAPMLGEMGQAWINEEISLSADMLQSGATSAFSILGKSTEATQATSTQDIVRASAEMSGLTANMQLQEMQQTAKMQQSLWQMQRTSSAQLQLAADMSEAA
ncbi:MAG: hypothetical protein AAGE92_11175, partial [Cyanobacteria bacterium P01_G01_bin.4]